MKRKQLPRRPWLLRPPRPTLLLRRKRLLRPRFWRTSRRPRPLRPSPPPPPRAGAAAGRAVTHAAAAARGAARGRARARRLVASAPLVSRPARPWARRRRLWCFRGLQWPRCARRRACRLSSRSYTPAGKPRPATWTPWCGPRPPPVSAPLQRARLYRLARVSVCNGRCARVSPPLPLALRGRMRGLRCLAGTRVASARAAAEALRLGPRLSAPSPILATPAGHAKAARQPRGSRHRGHQPAAAGACPSQHATRPLESC